MPSNCNLLKADWPAPKNVHALTTTKSGGFSEGPFQGLNLGAFTRDDPRHIQANYNLLYQTAKLPSLPHWLSQSHSIDVFDVQENPHPIVKGVVEQNHYDAQNYPKADASISKLPNQVCVVLTGDCLPILVCDKKGTEVAAIHAGWRGLAAGIIEATIAKLNTGNEHLLAWLGPAISQAVYEVGQDVRDAFQVPGDETAFIPYGEKWKLDLYQAARNRLKRLNIHDIYGGGFCTFTDSERFYSARRSTDSGRMASLIWFS